MSDSLGKTRRNIASSKVYSRQRQKQTWGHTIALWQRTACSGMTYVLLTGQIKRMRGGGERVEVSTVSIGRNSGTPCTSVDEVLERWNEHYQQY